MTYLSRVFKQDTPQSEALPDRPEMVKNSAGGYSFEVNDWIRLDRFLIIGTEGGSYYANEHKMTMDSCDSVIRCIKEDGTRVVDRVVEISDSGRAAKNDQALFVLALVMTHGNKEAKDRVERDLDKVARIGTHILNFAMYINTIRGWGKSVRRTVSGWYKNKSLEDLVFQTSKYRSRDGWSHRYVLRKARPKDKFGDRSDVYNWIVKGYPRQEDVVKEYYPIPKGDPIPKKDNHPYKATWITHHTESQEGFARIMRAESMDFSFIGDSGMTAARGAAAMSLVLAEKARQSVIMAFSDRLVLIHIKGETLQGTEEIMNRVPMGGTDCALPILYAKQHKIPVDSFVVITDSETWAGVTHPCKALEKYRQSMDIPAKLVVIGMCSNKFSIADPKDGGMMDVVGFDSACPKIIQDFIST